MRQIDDPVRLRRRAVNLERGPGRRVHLSLRAACGEFIALLGA